MKHTKPASTASPRTVGPCPDADHAILARRPGSQGRVRRSAAFPLTLLFATSLVAVVGGSVVGGSAAHAEDGGLVATVTKTGYGGHPYRWAAPSC